MPIDASEKDKIEKLKKRLFSKDVSRLRKTHRGTFHEEAMNAPTVWKEPPAPVHHDTPVAPPIMFKKFFIGSLVFLFIALGIGAYSFFGKTNTASNQNVDVAIIGNAFTAGGEELPLQVVVTNKNSIQIETANLLIEYPKGSEDGDTGGIERKSESIGTIEAGKTFTYDARVMLFGEQGSTRAIKATVEYRLKNSNAILQKTSEYVVQISSAPLELAVKGPSETSSNQEVSFDVTATLKSEKPAQNMILKVDYPPGFQFTKATPSPAIGNNVWALGDLAQGVPKTITVTGIIIAPEGDERAFRIAAGTKSADDESVVGVVFNSLLHTVAIRKPFIEARIAINGETKSPFVVRTGANLGVSISWANNLPTRIDAVEVSAHISGNAFDETSLNNQTGFYDSSTDTIVWDQNTLPAFASIEPGDNGQLSFTMKPKGVLSGSPSITIEVSIKGRQPQFGTAVSEVNNFEKADIKIASDFQINAVGLHSVGPFTNTGPIPPKADQPTTYTITWTLTNSSNKVSNAVAKTTLPVFVTWKNQTSPVGENVTYDSATREVIWKIGTVQPGVGFGGSTRSASFQIELKPSITQVGSSVMLIDRTNLSGQDTFTGASMVALPRAVVTTNIISDPAFVSGNDKVVQ